jgi:hypothetical protein
MHRVVCVGGEGQKNLPKIPTHPCGSGGYTTAFIENSVLGVKYVANTDWVEGLWGVPGPVLLLGRLRSGDNRKTSC